MTRGIPHHLLEEPAPRTEALFLDALELPAGEVDGFLHRACGADHALERDVRAMLEAAADAEGYFDDLASRLGVAADVVEDVPSLSGRQLGAYRLLELLGRGGMGAVYLAERADRQFEKRVAVKVLPVGYAESGAVARFMAERQMLARLVHPNIARLLDGGVTDDGTPYFVMDYVQGLPIDDYCRQHQLGIPERLALFTQVCRAVAYAHRHLIIHRDLKPGNVLVDDAGRVALLDFGVAKLLERGQARETRLTELAGRALTPDYAAPERLLGEPLTVTADVYSLGVLLYELLCDHRPYALSGVRLERAILETDPVRPSDKVPDERRKLLRGDLDTIVMKALAKPPEARYATVDALADDIARQMSGHPVLAQPHGRGYVLWKFIVRNRWGVGAVAAVLMAVLTGSGLALWQADRARSQAEVAEQVAEFLVSIFQISDPGEARGNSITAREILDRAAGGISAGLDRDPEVRARLLGVIGQVYRALGLYDQARGFLAEALEIQRRVLGREVPATLRSMNELADIYTNLGEYARAEAMFSEVLDIQRRSLGNDHPDTLNSMNDLAIARAQQGAFADGAELLEQVVAARRVSLGPEHPDTLSPLQNLAVMYKLAGRLTEAEASFQKILAPYRRVFGSDHPHTIGLMQNLADLYSEQGRSAEAKPLYVEALALSRRVRGSDHPDTARLGMNLANWYRNTGDPDAAEPLYIEMLAVRRRMLGDDHSETLSHMSHLGDLYTDQGRYDEAERLQREVLERSVRVLGATHPYALQALDGLIRVLIAAGQVETARPFTQRMLAVRRELAEGARANPDAWNAFAWALLTCEPEDLRDPRRGLELAVAANRESGFSDVRYLKTLARGYYASGDTALAIRTQRQAIERLPDHASKLFEELTSALTEFNQRAAGPAEPDVAVSRP